MVKRLFDIVFSVAAIVATLPIVIVSCILIFAEDGRAPLYLGLRVGRFGRNFHIFKLRTMIRHGERFGGSSTPSSDARLTSFGPALRRCKLDELPQFWNVLLGDMSIVGPRPNIRHGGVERYTASERELLSVRPGITDLASIVFSDEGEILNGSTDPDALYEAVIRPWKNRLGLLYVKHRTHDVDLQLIFLTLIALVFKPLALRRLDAILSRWGASAQLRQVCRRTGPLPVGTPPGQAT